MTKNPKQKQKQFVVGFSSTTYLSYVVDAENGEEAYNEALKTLKKDTELSESLIANAEVEAIYPFYGVGNEKEKERCRKPNRTTHQ